MLVAALQTVSATLVSAASLIGQVSPAPSSPGSVLPPPRAPERRAEALLPNSSPRSFQRLSDPQRTKCYRISVQQKGAHFGSRGHPASATAWLPREQWQSAGSRDGRAASLCPRPHPSVCPSAGPCPASLWPSPNQDAGPCCCGPSRQPGLPGGEAWRVWVQAQTRSFIREILTVPGIDTPARDRCGQN